MKRMIAVLLCICMLCAMVPAAAAEDAFTLDTPQAEEGDISFGEHPSEESELPEEEEAGTGPEEAAPTLDGSGEEQPQETGPPVSSEPDEGEPETEEPGEEEPAGEESDAEEPAGEESEESDAEELDDEVPDAEAPETPDLIEDVLNTGASIALAALEGGVYKIAAAEDLLAFAAVVKGGNRSLNAVLTADIDMSGTSWTAIGTLASNSTNASVDAYTGTFDGGGHTISGLNNPLFGALNGASVKDLILADVAIKNDYPLSATGALSSGAYSSTLENVTIASGTVKGINNVGGLTAYAYDCDIVRCANHADVSGQTIVGGLVARVYATGSAVHQIDQCVNTGSVTSTAANSSAPDDGTGGLIGSGRWPGTNAANAFLVTECSNTGDVAGGSLYVGGFIGHGYETQVFFINCYNTGTVTCINSNAKYAGGFVGYSEDTKSRGRYLFNYSAAESISVPAGTVKGGFSGSLEVGQSYFYVVENYWLAGTAAQGDNNGRDGEYSTASNTRMRIGTVNTPEELLDAVRDKVTQSAVNGIYYASALVVNPGDGWPVLSWQVCSDGHDYAAQVTAPTCTEKGYTTYTCKQCGTSYTGDETPAAGHVWDEGELTVPPTCTEEGEMLYTCTVCGETRTEAVEKAEHNFSITEVTAPTCTEEGYTTHICQVCGESYRDEEVEALGHDYGEPEVTPARCTEDGLSVLTCQREDCAEECEGHTVTEVIPALGHEFVDGVCVHEGCGLTTAEACYWLAIETDARWAVSVTVTGEDGEAVQPDGLGRWLLAKPSVYQYQIAAEHYLDEAGQFQWAGPLWSRGEDDEDGVACYTMRVRLSPVSNTAAFQGNGVTVTVDGAAVTETEIVYGEDLEFQLDVPSGSWVSSMKAVIEQAVPCADVWQGNIGTEFGGGSGTQGDPYLISTCAQLAFLAEMVNGGNTYAGVYFLLTENLDMDGRPWTPIGFCSMDLPVEPLYPFAGVFDGGGHVIRNLSVDTTNRLWSKDGGLFGALSGAQVKNLGLAQCSIRAGSYCGAVASTIKEGSVIENCWATGTVTGGTNYTGGIVGKVYSSSAVRSCWSGAFVTRTNEALGGVGGIAGYVTAGTVAGCWNIGTVTAGGKDSTSNYGVSLGGVVGYLDQAGTVENCYNSGPVTYTGAFYNNGETVQVYYGTGGVVGCVQSSSTTSGDVYLRGCYNSGAVTANTGRAGGVLGNALCRLSAYIEITGCYSTGRVTMLDSTGYAGGLAGRVYSTDANYFQVMRSYATGQVSASRGGGLIGSAQTVTLGSLYAREGMANSLFYQNAGTANGAAAPAFVPASGMQTGEFIVLLSGGAAAFTDDLYGKNGGFPVLAWQMDRPDVFGEYQELPIEEADGVYCIRNVVQPVTVRIETCAALTEKQVVFDVQPSNLVSASLKIVVLDSAGTQVLPEAGTVQTFTLTVGETYRYTITADDFVTVEGTLAVTESSSRLINVRMTEGGPSHAITFEGNRSHLTLVDMNDTPLGDAVRVSEGGSFFFYLAADAGYEIASVRISGGETKLDIWDGRSSDVEWYTKSRNQKEYTLTTAAQLAGLSLLVGQGVDFDNVTIYLDADLDLSAGSFEPIGSCINVKLDGTITNIASVTGTPFRGTFNGNGHTITASISQTNLGMNSYLGLFGWLDGATVENLTAAGSVQGGSYSAAVAGLMIDSTVRNCISQMKVTLGEYGGAGIAGRACGECYILNCRNEGPVTGGTQVAGIVSNACKYVGGDSELYVLIQGCQNTGKITASSSIYGVGAGGIAISNVHLESCSNSGTIISAASWNGGLTACGALSMRNCYNVGDIYCEKDGGLFINTNYVGGLMGSGNCSMVMENCYNAGQVRFTGSTGGAAGSLVGSLSQGMPVNFLNNYWVSGTSTEAIFPVGGVKIISTERQIKEVSANELRGLFSTLGDGAWREDVTGSNYGYPVLRNTPPTFASSTLKEIGDGVYQIPAVNQDATIYITVLKLLDNLELNAAHLDLTQGEVFQLIPNLEGTDADNWTVTWSSSDETAAAVNSAGVVTAVGAGTAVITAEAGGRTAVCTVTVTRKTYPVTLTGALGETAAAEGQDYTGMIEDYDGEQYVYTVTYQVGTKEAKAALDTETGMFTIPGEDITGALTVTVTRAEIGSAVERTENYATGYTLVTIQAEPGIGYCYNGKPMFYVEAYGGYAWLIEAGEEEAVITIDEYVECAVIKQGDCDINQVKPSQVDFNDALCAFACYNGLAQFPVSQWMETYLRSDVNGDRKIDAGDISEILRQRT